MPFNGSELMDNPFETIFSPFTDFFELATGNGGFFFVFVVIILAIGLYIKTKDLTFTSMFVVASFGILSLGTYMGSMIELSILFAVFCALGLVALIMNLVLHLKS